MSTLGITKEAILRHRVDSLLNSGTTPEVAPDPNPAPEPKARPRKVFNDREVITLTFELAAPRLPRDRVTRDALRNQLIEDNEDNDVWPDPDHEPHSWEPEAGYRIEEITAPALVGRLLTENDGEPIFGSLVMVDHLVWRRGKNSRWYPANKLVQAHISWVTWDQIRPGSDSSGPVLLLEYQD